VRAKSEQERKQAAERLAVQNELVQQQTQEEGKTN
jgi:hypothetical protein